LTITFPYFLFGTYQGNQVEKSVCSPGRLS
jgi:hypothetical protein